MGKYNFDTPIDRRGTNALKTDVLKERYGSADLIPLWVADMDFEAPPCVKEAIAKRAQHGIFGYTCPSNSYYQSIIDWVGNLHRWTIQKEWLSFIPGIVKGIAFVIDCFTKEGDKVIIQPPVYHPFRIVPTLHRREVVYNPLILDGDNYRIDFDLFQEQAKDAKLFILCNPHNPGGRVWTADELRQIADICAENDVLVISDEIHSDLAFAPYRHVPFALVSETAAQNSITFMAPSKTFNIAGIVSSYSVIPNENLRNHFHSYLHASELHEGHIFAYLATEAVYKHGHDWLAEVKNYMWDNIVFTDNFLKQNIPAIKAMLPQASFLVWIDCRELGLTHADLVKFFLQDAKLALHEGSIFGAEGKGFMRLNIACARSVLELALNQLKNAYDKRFGR